MTQPVVTQHTRRNSHYYTVSGDPSINDGAELPGITSIVGAVIAKPWLTNWAINETLKAVDLVALEPNSNLLSLTSDAKVLANKNMKSAAEVGTAIHEAITKWLRLKYPPEVPTGQPADLVVDVDLLVAEYIDSLADDIKPQVHIGLASCRRFIEDNLLKSSVIWATEMPVYSPDGFGGTIDCIMSSSKGLTIVDWKSGSTIGADNVLQVAAYALALEYMIPKVQIRAVIVQLNKTGPAGYSAYTINRLPVWQNLFGSAHALWKQIHNFKITGDV